MNILVIGRGGREHAIAKITARRQSQDCLLCTR